MRWSYWYLRLFSSCYLCRLVLPPLALDASAEASPEFHATPAYFAKFQRDDAAAPTCKVAALEFRLYVTEYIGLFAAATAEHTAMIASGKPHACQSRTMADVDA